MKTTFKTSNFILTLLLGMGACATAPQMERHPNHEPLSVYTFKTQNPVLARELLVQAAQENQSFALAQEETIDNFFVMKMEKASLHESPLQISDIERPSAQAWVKKIPKSEKDNTEVCVKIESSMSSTIIKAHFWNCSNSQHSDIQEESLKRSLMKLLETVHFKDSISHVNSSISPTLAHD